MKYESSDNEIKNNPLHPFIVIEGIDRSGKSTLASHIEKILGSDVKRLDFPQRQTEIGKLIDNYLQKKLVLPIQAVHLLFSANRWEFENKMRDRETPIVSARYFYSGIAYTMTVTNNVDYEWAVSPDKGLPLPDILFLINSDAGKNTGRENYGDEIYDNAEFQSKCMKNFLKITEKEKNLVILDGNKSLEELKKDIEDFLTEFLKNFYKN